jgi:hypothetical protein
MINIWLWRVGKRHTLAMESLMALSCSWIEDIILASWKNLTVAWRLDVVLNRSQDVRDSSAIEVIILLLVSDSDWSRQQLINGRDLHTMDNSTRNMRSMASKHQRSQSGDMMSMGWPVRRRLGSK